MDTNTETASNNTNGRIDDPTVEAISDITFFVAGKSLHAHKAILAGKSKIFKDLFVTNADKNMIEISSTSTESFRLLLKFIYTGKIASTENTELLLEILVLARQYGVNDLELNIVNKIKGILNTKNVIFFVNGANSNDLHELGNICHSFIDTNASQILSSKSFNNLTQTSLLEILNRNTFMAPETEIFNSVAKWCEKNDDTDNLVAEFVHSSISKTLSVVLPKIVSSETLKTTISKIVDDNSNDLSVPYADENIASVQRGAAVVDKGETSRLLNGNANVNLPVQHKIGDNSGILIQLSSQYYVNHIRMRLYDEDDRCYFYYIETSNDGQEWHKVVDYTKYACRSIQNLYFERQKCQYIRIVGTRILRNTSVSNFELLRFEAFYKSQVPKTINAVICPEENVVTVHNNTVVQAGDQESSHYLLDGDDKHFSTHQIEDPNGIIVQLAQPYNISTMQLLLNKDCKYFVQTSINGTDWEILVDKTNEMCSDLENLEFPERVAVFFKITGTFTSLYRNTFSCYRFKCPSGFKREISGGF